MEEDARKDENGGGGDDGLAIPVRKTKKRKTQGVTEGGGVVGVVSGGEDGGKKAKAAQKARRVPLCGPPIANLSLRRCMSETTAFEIGVDEAGRGPLFGRVYVAGVVLPKKDNTTCFDTHHASTEGFIHSWMKDSKQIKSDLKMAALAQYIQQHALAYHIAFAEPETIDRRNILQATVDCMQECVRECARKLSESTQQPFPVRNSLALVDGSYFRPVGFYNEITEELLYIPHQTVEQGDASFTAIAAASILAKHARDAYIQELCQQYPVLHEHYGLASNMGYGTATHMDGIRTHGITPWHRRSFRPCQGVPVQRISEQDHVAAGVRSPTAKT